MEVLNSMVKYKVNLKFKENGKSLNEIITGVLKIEINKIVNKTCNILNKEVLSSGTHYSQNGGSSN
jgi:hypothetical protein